METVAQLIGTFGFPISACIIMGWYVKYMSDKHSKELSDLNQRHGEELKQITEAVNNNTQALVRLCEKLEV